jgi:hypothetical protein
MFWLIALFLGFWLFTDTRSKSFRFVMGTVHGLVHVSACLVLGWLSAVIAYRLFDPPWSYDQPPQLLLAAAVLFVGGWVVGSIIMGVYLLVSLNGFGKHWNESFSSLRIADYKNFLRFKIEPDRLTIYPVGLPRVARWRWRSQEDATGDALSVPELAAPGAKPILIEEAPVEVMRKEAAAVVPPQPQALPQRPEPR